MPQPLPSDFLDNCDGFFVCIGLYLNEVTAGLFWAGALLSFCLVLFIGAIGMKFGSARAFGFAGFAAIMGGIWLAILSFLDWGIASAFIIVGAVSFVVLVLNEK